MMSEDETAEVWLGIWGSGPIELWSMIWRQTDTPFLVTQIIS